LAELKYAEAIRAALDDELGSDDNVVVLGEEVGPLGGVFTVTQGLQERYGEDRVMDSPIAENGLVGWAIGAASQGMRPVVEIMFSDFVLLALDQIVNLGAKLRFMSNGQFALPLVIRMPGGGGTNHGPQHSQSLESLFAQIPGLIVAMPSTSSDAYWMLREAIRSDDPVIFLESKHLYFRHSGDVDQEQGAVGYGGRVARPGNEMTVVSVGRMVHRCAEACEELAADGVEAEIIDLRYIWPLDTGLIASSVQKTSRIAVVSEAVEFCGWSGEVAAWVSEHLFEHLDAPIIRVGSARSPIPFQPHLEDEVVPTTERIAAALRQLAEY
jgi:pyruvate/2-oxoglutarate/acetoin dehydrogenase E1 component